jgi:Tfp pilus assembly protein PilF
MGLAVASNEAMEGGQPDSALVLARRALREPDVTVDVLGLVATVFMRSGLVADAERAFQQATKMDSTNAQIWTGLGTAQGAQQKWDAAKASFRRALLLDPQDATARRSLQALEQRPDKP